MSLILMLLVKESLNKFLLNLVALEFVFLMQLMNLVKKHLVYVGIDAKGKNILEITTVNDHGKLAVTEGMSADRGQYQTISWFS